MTDQQSSFRAIAESIARSLRDDIGLPGSGSQLATAITTTMIAEARAAELRVAYLRLVVVFTTVLITAIGVTTADVADSTLVRFVPLTLGLVWLGVALGIAVALRRGWYQRWVPHTMPVITAAMVLAIFVAPSQFQQPREVLSPALLAYIVAICAFMATAGGLRLSHSSANSATVLAVVVSLVAAAASEVPVVVILGIGAIVLATGLLSNNMMRLVRRLVADEVARLTLKQMYREAQETIDAREQVLKIVSHDLRNPLNTIEMSASLLLEVPTSGDQLADNLRRIKRAGHRMNRLIEDLLDVARLESGRLSLDAKPMDLLPVLREAHEMLSPLAGENGLTLELKCEDGLPTITADAGRILQVLSNLVGNAIKFTPKGGRISLRALGESRGVQLSVADTGPGIPPEQISKIFGRYWVANAKDRRGIGLGLSIAKGIVEAHGGRLWVESRVGEGTTFLFTLHQELPPSASGARERRQGAASA